MKEIVRICTKCKIEKPITEFTKRLNRKGKLHTQCKQCIAEGSRKSHLKVRLLVLYHYSNGKMICACCGEDTIGCLTLDHVNNDGADHRKKIGDFGNSVNRWIIKNNFPEGFQVLCYNCNCSKGANKGICSHKLPSKEKEFRMLLNEELEKRKPKVKYSEIFPDWNKQDRPQFRKVVRPSKEELNKMLWEIPSSEIAKKFGVSGKTIEKWAKRYGLVKPIRGYWQKVKAGKI